MTLFEQISKDFTDAYKNRDMDRKNFIGVLKNEITRVDKNPSDDSIIKEIKSMIKRAEPTDSLTQLEKDVLVSYLPSQMDESELTIIITGIIDNNGYDSMKDMGKIMASLSETHNGQYDGRVASTLIKNMLATAQ